MAKANQERTTRRSIATDDERALVQTMLARLNSGRDLRRAKVRRVRAAIISREYENSLKVAVAADRVADELASSP